MQLFLFYNGVIIWLSSWFLLWTSEFIISNTFYISPSLGECSALIPFFPFPCQTWSWLFFGVSCLSRQLTHLHRHPQWEYITWLFIIFWPILLYVKEKYLKHLKSTYGSMKGLISSTGMSTQPALEIGTLCMKIGQGRGRKGTAQNQTSFNDSYHVSLSPD